MRSPSSLARDRVILTCVAMSIRIVSPHGRFQKDSNILNITWHHSTVRREQRESLFKQRSCTIWLTGLPASGKTTTAFAIEYSLITRGFAAFVLDGDNVRHGLNKDLGFSAEDRKENIRRIGEVAKLFAESGIILIASFISPYRNDRDNVRMIHNNAGLCFIEVFINTPLAVCIERDPKGLYAKAKRGELIGLTGIDAPYEDPLHPEIVLNTQHTGPQHLSGQVLDYLVDHGYLFV